MITASQKVILTSCNVFKREQIKETLILIIGRVIYLSQDLAKYSQEPDNQYVFSSEYVGLRDHLIVFKEDSEKIRAERIDLVLRCMKMKLDVTSIPIKINTSGEADIYDQKGSNSKHSQI